MNTTALLVAACLGTFAGRVQAVESPSSYAGQERREIKALSADDVKSLESGKGMGLAKAAELNGYPGPAHVLQLAEKLNLTPQQHGHTQALFDSMEAKAISLGRQLVAAERDLDQMFSSGRATDNLIAAKLSEIGALQAKVRGAHLEVHLAQAQILTPEQRQMYAVLRGYSGGVKEPSHSAGHKH